MIHMHRRTKSRDLYALLRNYVDLTFIWPLCQSWSKIIEVIRVNSQISQPPRMKIIVSVEIVSSLRDAIFCKARWSSGGISRITINQKMSRWYRDNRDSVEVKVSRLLNETNLLKLDWDEDRINFEAYSMNGGRIVMVSAKYERS